MSPDLKWTVSIGEPGEDLVAVRVRRKDNPERTNVDPPRGSKPWIHANPPWSYAFSVPRSQAILGAEFRHPRGLFVIDAIIWDPKDHSEESEGGAESPRKIDAGSTPRAK